MKRKLFQALILTVLLLIVLTNWSTFTWGASRLAGKLVLYVNVARLYTREADRKLSMPVLNVSRKAIANTWHAPRGSNRQHEGQDIFAPKGTPVISVTEGYVLRIGENTLGGNTVSVIGAGGRSYYYAHLDSYAPGLAEGDFVTRQTVLGFIGATGNAQGTPPHLHFGVYAPGGAINPLPLLTDRDTKRPARDSNASKPAKFKNARTRKT